MNRMVKGALCALCGGLCWGISGSIGQFIFNHTDMQTEWLVPIRLFSAGVIILIWNLIRNRDTVMKIWQNRNDVRDLIIYAIFGVGCSQLFYFRTIQYSTAGIATILQDLSPIPILAVTCVMAGRLPRRREVLSIVLAIIGVTLITTHGQLGRVSVSFRALVSGILCAVTVALYNIQPARLLGRYPLLVVQSWAFILSGAMFFVIFRPWSYHYVPDGIALLCIVAVIAIGNLLAFPIYMKGVGMIGGKKANLYGFMEPISAAVISTLWLGSPFTVFDAIGFACVFAMLVLISTSE